MSLAPVTATQLWSSAGTGRWRPAARQKRVGEASPHPQFRHPSAHCAAIVGVIIRMQEPIQSAISPAKHAPWWGA
jgi:hypothetical protein